MGKVCALLDIERTFDPVYAVRYGVDLEKLVLINQYETAEEALDFFIKLVKEGAIDLGILDSIQSLSPKGEQETKKGVTKSLEDDTMALLARKLSQFFRMTAGSVFNNKVAVLLIGQSRMDLGGFIAFETLSGGKALAHWSSMTLRLKRGSKSDSPTIKVKDVETGKSKEEIVGFACNMKLEKTKIQSQVEGSEITIPFYFREGFKGEQTNELS
jgi:RecA/RadA recombinase